MGKKERKNRTKWKYSSKECRMEISKHSKDFWIKKVVDYVYETKKKNRVPFFTRFWKEEGLWIFWLDDDVTKGKYTNKKYKDFLDTFLTIKKIIKDSIKENVIERNIDKASFALQYLSQESDWDQVQHQDQKQLTVNLVNFSNLLPGEAQDTPQLPNSESPTVLPIIDVKPLEPLTEPTDFSLKDSLKDILGER